MRDRRVGRGGLAVGIALSAVLVACRPGEVPRAAPTPARLPSGASPLVRVGLVVDTAAIEVGSSQPFELRALDDDGQAPLQAPADERWTVRLARAGVEAVSNRGRSMRSAAGIGVRPESGTIEIGGRPYRGEAVLRGGRDGITAINVVDLEAYLLGVVPREIGKRPMADLEAVKAQAIAARTYAIGNLGVRENLGFDYFASVQDQVYGGALDEDSTATRAVLETRGEIVTYHGTPILAYYSSTCGGRTAAIEESWPWRAPLPYLRSVSDRIPGTDEHYCSTSNRFRWSTSWTRAQLLATLGQTLRAYTGASGLDIARVEDIRIQSTGESGRVTLQLTADSVRYTLRADSLRWVLRTPAGGGLNSSRIERIEVPPDGDGSGVAALTVHGGGWGHAIGMCQVGALGRARSGQTYDQILKTYYQGTEIRKLY
jgi:stage II sporulation protein D